jgi:hypothetical protein
MGIYTTKITKITNLREFCDFVILKIKLKNHVLIEKLSAVQRELESLKELEVLNAKVRDWEKQISENIAKILDWK